MAVTSRVQAVFSANASGLTAGTKRASTALDDLRASVGRLQRGMSALVAINGAQLFAGVASGAAKALAGVAGLARSIGSQIKDAVGEAVGLGEETSKSVVVFGQAAGAISKFAKSAADIGLSEKAALQATGTFGTLFAAMGVGEQDAAKYSEVMARLSADLASFSNASIEESLLAVGAALRGEAEPIRRFGVLLNEATLKNEALSQGLIKNAKGSLDPATRAMAAYHVILRQTALAQGDFVRTSDGLANLQRVVQAKAANIVSDIGGAFVGLFASATAAVSNVMDAIRPLIGEITSGIGQALAVVAKAITAVSDNFIRFTKSVSLDGVADSVRDTLLDGIVVMASGADAMISGLMSAWNYVSQVTSQFGGVTATLSQAAAVLKAVFSAGEAVFRGVAALLLRSLSGYAQVVALLPQSVVGDGWVQFAQELNNQANEMSRKADQAAANALSNAWAGLTGEMGDSLGEAIEKPAGAIQGFIEELRRAGVDAAGAAGGAAAGAVVDAGKGAATLIARASAAASKSVSAVDARSTSGVNQIVAAINGKSTNDELQEARKQTRLLQEIAAKEDAPLAEVEI